MIRIRNYLLPVVFAAALSIGAAHAENRDDASPDAGAQFLSPDAAADFDPEKEPELAEIEALRLHLIAQRDEVLAFERDAVTASGDDQIALRERALHIRFASMDSFRAMIDGVLALEKSEIDASFHRRQLRELLPQMKKTIVFHHAEIRKELDRLKRDLAEGDGPTQTHLAQRIRRQEALTARVLDIARTHIEMLEDIELDASEERAWLLEEVGKRARLMSGRIQMLSLELEDFEQQASISPDDSALQQEAASLTARRDEATAELGTTVELMDSLEMDTGSYKQLLIETSGEISTDIFDRGVAARLVSRWTSGAIESVGTNGPAVVFRTVIFVLVLAVFVGMSRIVRNVTRRAVEAPHLRFSELLKTMIVSVASGTVILLGVLIAMSQLGIEVGPMLAGLGIAGFVVGFALQDTLGNFAAGIMILAYRPYDVRDLIECAGGVFGHVSEMNLVSTTILTLDNQTRVVPNGKIWGDVITNVTAQYTRRVDLVFGISYSDDIPHTEEVLNAIVAEHPKVLAEPEAIVKLFELGDSSVNFVLRPWVETKDYWDVYWDITREVKMRFDREGISIPFPQRDVHFPSGARPVFTDQTSIVGQTPRSAQDPPDSED